MSISRMVRTTECHSSRNHTMFHTVKEAHLQVKTGGDPIPIRKFLAKKFQSVPEWKSGKSVYCYWKCKLPQPQTGDMPRWLSMHLQGPRFGFQRPHQVAHSHQYLQFQELCIRVVHRHSQTLTKLTTTS